jgi:sugar O-acyltransferase (sialic acid O-acetyltransferase NeuD family)
MKKLIIFGAGDIASLAHYYFTHDSDYEVIAFTVDREYVNDLIFENKPVVPFEELNLIYPPNEFDLFIALSYSNLNQIRRDKYESAMQKGYVLASYISTNATILSHDIGVNCFILEDNTIQPFVTIGNNVTLWSGNHIGHHSIIKDHVFISSHVVISGGVEVGEQSFLGVNSTIRDHVKIGVKNVIGAGTLILKSCEDEGLYIGTRTERSQKLSSQIRKI